MKESPSQIIHQYKLWIDGVGGYLLCSGDEVVLGNRSQTEQSKLGKIPIQAAIRSEHCSILFESESYWLEAFAACEVNQSQVTERVRVPDDAVLTLEDVQLRVRIPSPLSKTAILQIESGHRMEGGMDGAILFRSTCLLGDRSQNHVVCRGWQDQVIIIQRQGQLFCKSQNGVIKRNGKEAGSMVPVNDGDFLEGEDWSMTFEAVSPQNSTGKFDPSE